MRLWRWLTSRFRARPGAADDPHALVFHVRCGRCGEHIRVRADRRWDLTQEFDDGVSGYVLRKEVLGERCSQLMAVHITFDRNYAILTREVEGGSFLSQDDASPEATSSEGASP